MTGRDEAIALLTIEKAFPLDENGKVPASIIHDFGHVIDVLAAIIDAQPTLPIAVWTATIAFVIEGKEHLGYAPQQTTFTTLNAGVVEAWNAVTGPVGPDVVVKRKPHITDATGRVIYE